MTLSVQLLSESQRNGLGAAFILVGWADILTNSAIVFVIWLFQRTHKQPDRILLALAIGYLFNSTLWAFAPTFFNQGHSSTCLLMMMHTFGRFITLLMELLILVFAITTLMNNTSEALWSGKVEVLALCLVHLISLIITVIFGTVFDWPCGSSSGDKDIDKVDRITEIWLAILALCFVAAIIMVYKYKQLRAAWAEADETLDSGWYSSVERHQKKTIMKVHQQRVASLVDPLLVFPFMFLLFAIPDIVKVTLDSQWGQTQKKELFSACVNLFVGLRGIVFAYVFFKEGDNMDMLSLANIKRKWHARKSKTHVAFGDEDDVVIFSKSATLRSTGSISSDTGSLITTSTSPSSQSPSSASESERRRGSTASGLERGAGRYLPSAPEAQPSSSSSSSSSTLKQALLSASHDTELDNF